MITHTRNDKAVGLAYAAASRLGRQNANAVIGGTGDVYGGLGANGAQQTPEAEQGTLLAALSAYTFHEGTVHNLLADAFINGHNAITGPEVATAVLAAIRVSD